MKLLLNRSKILFHSAAKSVWEKGEGGQCAKASGCFLLTSHGCRMTSNVLICKARLSKQRVRSDLCGFTGERKAPVFSATRFLQGN